MPKPFIPFSAKITRDIFDIRKKSKLKLVKKKTPSIIKLPAQKSPKSFLSEEAKNIETADKAARKKFGEGISYLPGMNVKSTQRLAAESYASQVEERMFSKTLFRERKASRLRTASGIKGKKFKIKTPTAPSKLQQKFGIFKNSSLPKSKASLRLAKSKGALGAYKTADVKGQQAFSKIVEKYTSQAKRSSFKVKTRPTKTPMDYREKAAYRQTVSSWGKDPDAGPDFNTDIMSGSSKRFPNYKFKKGQGPFASLATKKYNKKKY